MKARSVSIEDTRVVKRYPSATAATAALTRAAALQEAGLATPSATRLGPDALAFPRLSGRTGPTLTADLATLLAPLAALHATSIPGLAPQDPFRRITPRLSDAPAALRARVATLAAQSRPAPTVPVHGDFHPGQAIVTSDGTPWVIDLDDMALATSEADLGNLLAWLLTAPDTRDAPPPIGWRKTLCAAWRGSQLYPATLSLHTEIALIRRAMKRAEDGDSVPLNRLMAGGYSAQISAD